MAVIRPFRGIRPESSLASRVAALPYDVYNREEAYAEAAKDRLSFLNIDRPETQFDPEYDMYAPEVYAKADELLRQRIDEGVFVKDAEEIYYLYELTMNGRSQTGLVACASIDDYLNCVIKKHETTRAEKEADRIQHVDVCSAQTGPIFLAYRKIEAVSAITDRVKREEQMFDFVSMNGIHHRGWMIADKTDISVIQESFASVTEIYIADGHHRTASAVRAGQKRRAAYPDYTGNEEFNYFLSILFPDEELMIMDYNRVVTDLNGLTVPEFLDRVEEKCIVEPWEGQIHPQEKGTVGMYLKDQWYKLTIREAYRSDDPVEGLDVAILQREVLAPILNVGDLKLDNRIDFVGGIRGLDELERRVHTDCAVAFAMHPTSISELFAVADAGRLMPPKSTWFEPKLRSGLFIHEIER